MAYDKPLSYSGLSLYRRCPRAWAHVYVEGNRTPPAKAAMRGTRLHEALENYFNGGLWPESNEVLRPWKAHMYELATYFPTAEKQLAVDEYWYTTGFDSPNAQFRGAVDLVYVLDDTLHVKDWKSGKQYLSHKGQADMYAGLSWAEYGINKVCVEMVYLDIPKTVTSWNYRREDIDSIAKELNEEAKIVRADEEYLPTPSNDACKWCPLSWRNGGSCDKAP